MRVININTPLSVDGGGGDGDLRDEAHARCAVRARRCGQAREQLDVVTVICANSSYNILKLELALQRVGGGGKAARALTALDEPRCDWVRLGEGLGVRSSRAATPDELQAQLHAALQRSGPSLIEAVLA